MEVRPTLLSRVMLQEGMVCKIWRVVGYHLGSQHLFWHQYLDSGRSTQKLKMWARALAKNAVRRPHQLFYISESTVFTSDKYLCRHIKFILDEKHNKSRNLEIRNSDKILNEIGDFGQRKKKLRNLDIHFGQHICWGPTNVFILAVYSST